MRMQLHLHYRAVAELERSSRSATSESKADISLLDKASRTPLLGTQPREAGLSVRPRFGS